jgi:hypothetical protein
VNFHQRKKKAVFTVDEDKLIIKLIELMKTVDEHIKWVKIAAHFSSRTGKKIRERYLNYLNPNINRNPLFASELRLLTELVSDNGHLSRIPWKKISDSFPGRSGIFLKNQYDHARRKMMKTFDLNKKKKQLDEFFQLIWSDDDTFREQINEQLIIAD